MLFWLSTTKVEEEAAGSGGVPGEVCVVAYLGALWREEWNAYRNER